LERKFEIVCMGESESGIVWRLMYHIGRILFTFQTHKSGRIRSAHVPYRKDRDEEGERKQEPRYQDAFLKERSKECARAKAKVEESGDSYIMWEGFSSPFETCPAR